MAVTRRYLQLAGHATEVITVNVSGRKQTVGLQVLVWPGNPGAAGYYVPFMEALSQALQGRASVAAVSNLGQCTEGIPGKTFTLQEQAAHKLRYVREHALGPGRPPLCIVGHSIGAYVALQNLRALEAERAADQLQQVVALFPFLCFDTASWRQWALEHLAAWPRTAGAVLGAVGALPTAVPRALLRTLAPDLDTHAVEKTLGMLSYRHGRNALVLAGHEFRDLRPSPDWPWLQSLGARLAVICAPDDKWFPQKQWLELQDRLPTLEANMDMTMHHGFCVSVQKSRALAASVAALLHRSAAAAHLNGTPAEREGGGYQGDAAGVAADGTPEAQRRFHVDRKPPALQNARALQNATANGTSAGTAAQTAQLNGAAFDIYEGDAVSSGKRPADGRNEGLSSPGRRSARLREQATPPKWQQAW